VHNASTRDPRISQRSKTFPGDAGAVAPATKRPKPKPENLIPEGEHTVYIAGDSMIMHVATHHSTEPPTRLRKIVVEASPDLTFQGLELGTKALGNGLTTDGEMTAVPGSPTDMGETQEIEGLRPAFPPKTTAVSRKASELDEPGLIGMKAKAESGQAIPEVIQKTQGLPAVLESQDKVVGVPDDDHIASSKTTTPMMRPEVQDIVKVHVSQERRDDRPLRCAYARRRPLARFGDSCPKPFTDQAENPAVRNAVLEEFKQIVMVDGVEESLNICIEYPVHFPRDQAHIEGVQPIVSAAPRPEPVGEVEKVHLIDGIEHRGHRMLDDFVLQRDNPQRTPAAVGLGDVGSLGGQRSYSGVGQRSHDGVTQ
jgi:hypothetical protein